jgi:GNAT superfamily N-acetyltransferase
MMVTNLWEKKRVVMTVELIIADYENPRHGKDIVCLLNRYAQDDMGQGAPLAAAVQKNLVAELAKRPHAISVLAYVDGQAAALANCFEGFSSFKAKPLINIHDVYVHDDFRGLKLSHRLLEKIEEHARAIGCCKITLEVLDGNHPAKKSYEKFGFQGYELDPELGAALFWEKPLASP